MTRTHIAKWLTMLSVVLALALTAALAACGSDEPSGVTGPDRTASTPTETPASPAQTPITPGSGDTTTATEAPATAPAPAPPTLGPTSAETDREALVALYNSTDGENWSKSFNWLSDAPLGEWQGVRTNDDGRVTDLVLWGNDLSGEIPAELGSLSYLRELYLSENDLSGEIPAELGSLSNLEELYLHINNLSGEIPAELGGLSSLEELYLAGNKLSGCMPSSWEDQLNLDFSLLSGLPYC